MDSIAHPEHAEGSGVQFLFGNSAVLKYRLSIALAQLRGVPISALFMHFLVCA